MKEIIEVSEALELNQQASILLGIGKIQEALEFLEKARDLDPMEKETYYNLGSAYSMLEDYEKAEDSFKKVILINKKDGQVYFHLGNIKFLQDSIEKGVEYYNKAVANGFDEAILYSILSRHI